MSLQLGSRIAHYEILESIGAGGMGEVYRARDQTLGRDVAIKVLRAAEPEKLRRFAHEARAASALNHPNIVTIYGFGEHQGTPYIAMEYVEGQTLREILRDGPVRDDKLMHFAIQIGEGLAKAHQAGIVHRDLKPGNIVVSTEEHVKILDFGLAKPVPTDDPEAELSTLDKATRPGTILGTVGYMSPEQAKGKEAGYASDQFSLGAMIYEMATGTPAFTRETAAETLAAVLNDTPVLDGALGSIVERCLRKTATERWPSTADLVAALKVAETAHGKTSETPAVAVLPFSNMSPDPEQQYFCDGIAEELINALSKIPGLRVAARSSAFQFEARAHDIRQVGTALRVNKILEGSVRTAGNRLRVTAQLVNIADGYQIWSERYDREMGDVFAIQDEIATSIVNALRPELGGQSAAPTRRHPSDVETYQLYLKGRHAWEQRYGFGPHRALPFFENAVARAPGYALAHAGIADCHTILGLYGFTPPQEAFEKAQAAIDRALAIDDAVPEVQNALGLFHLVSERNYAGSEQAFERAIELNPADSRPWLWCSVIHALLGRRTQTRKCTDKSLELDPVSPYALTVAGCAGLHGFDNSRAIEWLEQAVEIDPDFSGRVWLIGAYGRAGRYEDAVSVTTPMLESKQRPAVVTAFSGWALGASGRADHAQSMLGELEERAEKEYVSPLYFATLYSGMGKAELAMQWLSRAEEEPKCPLQIYLKLPWFDSLREDAKFRALMERVGLPSDPPRSYSRGLEDQ